jgi:ribosomal protein S18 acetylase RimI-like enzyme
MTEIVIEKAEIKDLDTLYKIERGCFPENAFPKSFIKYLIVQHNSIFLKAQICDEIVGFVAGLLQDNYSIGRIYTLDVKPEFRRRSIASKLIETLENEFKKGGATFSTLEVEVNNTGALNLYQKIGYKTNEVLEDYYGKNRNGFKMIKYLV